MGEDLGDWLRIRGERDECLGLPRSDSSGDTPRDQRSASVPAYEPFEAGAVGGLVEAEEKVRDNVGGPGPVLEKRPETFV